MAPAATAALRSDSATKSGSAARAFTSAAPASLEPPSPPPPPAPPWALRSRSAIATIAFCSLTGSYRNLSGRSIDVKAAPLSPATEFRNATTANATLPASSGAANDAAIAGSPARRARTSRALSAMRMNPRVTPASDRR